MSKLEPLGLYRCTKATHPCGEPIVEPIAAELELVVSVGGVNPPAILTLSSSVDQFGDCNWGNPSPLTVGARYMVEQSIRLGTPLYVQYYTRRVLDD